MRNYRLQPRVLHYVEGTELKLPASITITLTLTPSASLGSPIPGRTIVQGGRTTINWDAVSDRHGAQSDPPLAPLQSVFEMAPGIWRINGETLQLEAYFDTYQQLDEWLDRLVLLLPGLLNVELSDSTAVVAVALESGPSSYRLQYQQGSQIIDRGTTQDLQEQRVAITLGRLSAGLVNSSKRLAAALHYFHVASRLLAVAPSPWEFMPEAVLNMNKVLEVLFSSERICQDSNVQARHELTRLGLEERQRETLISIMKLRSHMDVAHVDTWEYEAHSLDGAYQLLYSAESVMREMLRLLVAKVDSGEYELKPDWDSTPDPEVTDLLAILREMYCPRRY